jgi:secondary thiamine-phosphate synthase enzyme
MKQAATILQFSTHGRGLLEITSETREWLAATGVETGLATLFCRHTSASLVIQENASPEVRTDLDAAFARLPRKRRVSIGTTRRARTTCPRIFAPR